MLRGENVVCGISTNGVGTQTLVACPAPPGGADFYQWLTSTGIGFVNGNAVLVSYTLIEYTDATFATAKAMEKGVGTLTLGASLTASTLARTKVQTTGTALNTGAAAYLSNAPAAINIGTAANVLVFVAPAAADIIAIPPFFEGALGDNLGIAPLQVSAQNYGSTAPVSGMDIYTAFLWPVRMLVKRVSVHVGTAYSGVTPVSNAYGRLYAVDTNGRPGKLLYDFGLIGPANASLNTGNTLISSGAAGNGFALDPGSYFFDFLPIFSGGAVSPTIDSNLNSVLSGTCGSGFSALFTNGGYTATGGNATAPDPANVTGIDLLLNFGGGGFPLNFVVKDS